MAKATCDSAPAAATRRSSGVTATLCARLRCVSTTCAARARRQATFAELLTLIDESSCGASSACIDPIFGPVRGGYRSDTPREVQGPTYSVWSIAFDSGDNVFSFANGAHSGARAVRGGF
jgi:hypothetical protein